MRVPASAGAEKHRPFQSIAEPSVKRGTEAADDRIIERIRVHDAQDSSMSAGKC
jgi:hypothetical protein